MTGPQLVLQKVKMGKHSSGKSASNFPRRPIVTAILVDGGFYRHRARVLFGKKDPRDPQTNF